MKATVIVDNIGNIYPGEWGLCIYIENNGKNILLDAGSSNLFIDNAKKLNLNLQAVDYGVLSHAHYDHANGIPAFLDLNKNAKFYIQRSTAPNCYSRKKLFRHYIGIPKRLLTDYADRIVYVDGDLELDKGVYIIPHKTANLVAIGRREKMYQKTSRGYVFDDFSHEQSLVIDTDKGLVIFNSCSHGGANNIINEVQNTFKDKKVYGLVGGFHLFNKTEQEVRDLAHKIKETNIEYICTGHCTKEAAYNILNEELGDKLHQLHVGLEMNF
ncbi:MAG: MBL fold metallo-hydrolase [Erysipelotrichaceae bacterium]|nr:MBL fold metallo-hydrolase [Erysipelotrichaceae bacterium]